MKRYTLLDTQWSKVLFGFFLFAMLLLARDTLITSCLLGFTKSQFLMLGLICLVGLWFLIRNRRDWKQILTDRRVCLLVITALILLVPMVVKRDWQMMYFSILICLVFPVFLSYFVSVQEAARCYVMSMAVLSLYSLVGMYVLKGVANDGLIPATVFFNSQDVGLYNFGLACVVPDPYWNRNFGIFREPGVYQFFLILGLYLNLYVLQWNRPIRMWAVTGIFAVTMLSTFAIGGFIEMGLLAVFIFFDKKYHRTKLGKLLAAIVIASLLAVVAYVLVKISRPNFENTIYYEFFDMFRRLTTDSDSLVDRFSAIFVSAGLFLRSPFFGDTIANVLHGTAHNTSSTLILFAVFGVAGGMLNVVAWMALLWKKERNLFGNLVLMLILFMSFNTQNLVADVFFWLFPYMALTEVLLPKMKFPERKV